MSEKTNAEIRHFIVENFLFGDSSQLSGDDASLIENEIIDSTGVLELVTFMEERYGISVADAEIVPDNLDSVSRIAAYVTRKRAEAGLLESA